jgi:hypothetical protein
MFAPAPQGDAADSQAVADDLEAVAMGEHLGGLFAQAAQGGAVGVVTILEGQALSGATDMLKSARQGPYIAANRAWTVAEKDNITAYLVSKGAGL